MTKGIFKQREGGIIDCQVVQEFESARAERAVVLSGLKCG